MRKVLAMALLEVSAPSVMPGFRNRSFASRCSGAAHGPGVLGRGPVVCGCAMMRTVAECRRFIA